VEVAAWVLEMDSAIDQFLFTTTGIWRLGELVALNNARRPICPPDH
jgi:hypothetical protein